VFSLENLNQGVLCNLLGARGLSTWYLKCKHPL